jgi:methylthioribose-1-phosphate isomerase
METKPVEWVEGKVRLIDQTKLPHREVFLELGRYQEVVAAIKGMKVRGAPAIGIAAAYGLALGAQSIRAAGKETFLRRFRAMAQAFATTRPTAVNLFWAIERMRRVAASGDDPARIKEALIAEAKRIDAENEAANRTLGRLGAELIEDGSTILTHCNTGPLATGGYGTALGVIRAAHEQGKRVRVYATETRPLLQGARLTTWELMRLGIPVTLISDTMCGYFMARCQINYAIVGADRIAANGDTANKIGTYPIAVLAMEHGVPFYVAAPTSTLDLSIPSGKEIPIEERRPEEVTHIRGVPIAPPGVAAANPAFDITPHYFISAIITEKGILYEPYEARLKKLGHSGEKEA